MLTPAQKVTLKAHIIATPDLNALFDPASPTGGNLDGVAALLNALAAPAFWAWRTNVTREQVYNQQNDLPVAGAQTGFWNWTTYKNQSVSEQNAWTQMFMGDLANFAAQNIRDGIAAIFTGAGAPTAQREHCLAIGRRTVTRAEKLFAVGTGSAVTPATMAFEGQIASNDLVNL